MKQGSWKLLSVFYKFTLRSLFDIYLALSFWLPVQLPAQILKQLVFHFIDMRLCSSIHH